MLIFIATYVVVLKQFATGIERIDYRLHANAAMAQGTLPNIGESAIGLEFLWHSLVMIVYNIIPSVTLEHATAITTSCLNVVSFAVVRKILVKENEEAKNIITISAFVIMFIAPLYIPWYNSIIYLGQGIANVWHNPTTLCVKPFALVAFALMVSVLEDASRNCEIKTKRFVSFSVVMFVSCLAKPSLIQIVLPGLGLYLLRLLLDKRNKATFLLCFKFGVALIPALILMAFQFFGAFFSGTEGNGGIEIAPFVVWDSISPNILISLLLGFAFPLVVFVCNYKKLKDIDSKLAMVMFLAGYLEYALFAEIGERRFHGNFSWGAGLSMLFVYVVAMKKFIDFNKTCDINNKRQAVLLSVQWIVFIASVWFGFLYFYKILTVPGMWM